MTTFEQTERRERPRIDVDVNAIIKPSGRSAPISCVVRNMSETGAKIEVANINFVPDAFQLHLEDEGFSADCVVVWRSKKAVGVVFQSMPKF